jgi:hypothetical protein
VRKSLCSVVGKWKGESLRGRAIKESALIESSSRPSRGERADDCLNSKAPPNWFKEIYS